MRARGFTLVEVLVALLVVALALFAVIGVMAQQSRNAAHYKEKTLALWVAHNRLAELQLQPQWPDVGRSDGSAEMAGIEWRWELEVGETEDDRLRRVDIAVRSPADDRNAAEIDGFLAPQ